MLFSEYPAHAQAGATNAVETVVSYVAQTVARVATPIVTKAIKSSLQNSQTTGSEGGVQPQFTAPGCGGLENGIVLIIIIIIAAIVIAVIIGGILEMCRNLGRPRRDPGGPGNGNDEQDNMLYRPPSSLTVEEWQSADYVNTENISLITETNVPVVALNITGTNWDGTTCGTYLDQTGNRYCVLLVSELRSSTNAASWSNTELAGTLKWWVSFSQGWYEAGSSDDPLNPNKSGIYGKPTNILMQSFDANGVLMSSGYYPATTNVSIVLSNVASTGIPIRKDERARFFRLCAPTNY